MKENNLFSLPRYIRKYDMMRYYCRHPSQYFWPTKLISKYLLELAKQPVDDDIDEVDNNEEEEYTKSDEKEFDSIEYVRSIVNDLNSMEDLDLKDPKVIEGNIVDEKAKQFIIKEFNINNVIDFSSEKYFRKKIEDLANEVTNIVSQKKDIIMFQPTFLYKKKAIARPDAIIIKNKKIMLVETKATTSVKLNHLYDITYQTFIVEANNILLDSQFICLIKYELCDKNKITFTLSDKYTLLAPKIPKADRPNYPKYSEDWIDNREVFDKKQGYEIPGNINNFRFITKNWKDLIDIYRDKELLEELNYKNLKKNVLSLLENYIEFCTNFDTVLDKLQQHLVNFNFDPTKLDFTPQLFYKKNLIGKGVDYFGELQSYWNSTNKYDSLSFSGYVMKYAKKFSSTNNKLIVSSYNDLCDIINGLKKDNYIRTWLHAITNKQYISVNTNKRLKQLRNKIVYFDFETINLATRIVDNSLPFMQIVNQVSIIKVINNKIGECNNILIDPKNITNQSFKQIIDAICEDETWSYVVYNKGFETSRLSEMVGISLANDKEINKYYEKVSIINNNIYDLADFFDIRKNNPENKNSSLNSIAINIPELRGYYSIKKVLPVIQKYDAQAFKKTECIDYHVLNNIQNGKNAQDAAALRFFGIYDDNKWKELSNDLKKYCENDVRAMIAVYYFVEDIYNKKITKFDSIQ